MNFYEFLPPAKTRLTNLGLCRWTRRALRQTPKAQQPILGSCAWVEPGRSSTADIPEVGERNERPKMLQWLSEVAPFGAKASGGPRAEARRQRHSEVVTDDEDHLSHKQSGLARTSPTSHPPYATLPTAFQGPSKRINTLLRTHASSCPRSSAPRAPPQTSRPPFRCRTTTGSPSRASTAPSASSRVRLLSAFLPC